MGALRLRDDQPLDLSLTLSCGQAFRWVQRDGWWEGVVGESLWKVRQEGDRLSYSGMKAPALRHYLALDEDLPAILASVDRDPVIHRSIEACRGLRILRQDPWEILISFICATNTNIPRIRKMIASIARTFGRRVPGTGEAVYSFPGPEALSGACADDLAACRLGYRDRYVAGTAARVAEDPGILGRIAGLPFDEARDALLAFDGVGPKAADCILIFGYHRLEAFPVDVWVRRIMHGQYIPPPPGMKGSSEKEDRRIRGFGQAHFGEYAGYAQEYLFCARGILEKGEVRSPGPRTSGTPPVRR
ncbi:MAG TPA: DNA glycosylase [Methanomicrobiales archaeon]|nr:DNA glycosylase [Methanomicrobiales archaeon]